MTLQHALMKVRLVPRFIWFDKLTEIAQKFGRFLTIKIFHGLER